LGSKRGGEPGSSSALGELDEVRDRLHGIEAELKRLTDIVQLIYDREPENRERLRRLRATPEYDRAFNDAEPLVSVVIPTYQNWQALESRSVPSVLNQTDTNLELIVAGDAAPRETAEALQRFDDDRIVYFNLPHRGPYPAHPRDLWHVAGVPPRNEAVHRAGGQWIAQLDDDDAYEPDHLEKLLELAQKQRAEVAYGKIHCCMRNQEDFQLGAFPPRIGQFGWMGAIFHGGLRFFEMELADALFFQPADWSLLRRMVRAGVRYAMLDQVVVRHYESSFGPNYDAGEAVAQAVRETT
jgi:glycosyltransferase involved in cell wall biosynthesis